MERPETIGELNQSGPSGGSSQKIRIVDLMILTGCIAFFFMLYDNYRRQAATEQAHWLLSVINFVYAALFGTSLASLYWLGRQKMRSGMLFTEPGHWFLGFELALTVCIIPVLLLVAFSGNGAATIQDWQLLFVFGLTATGGLVGALMMALAVFLVPGVKWRFAIAGVGCFGASRALESLVSWVLISQQGGMGTWWSNLAVALQAITWLSMAWLSLAMLVAVVSDLVQRSRRSWLHWLGVGLVLAGSVGDAVAMWVYTRLATIAEINP